MPGKPGLTDALKNRAIPTSVPMGDSRVEEVKKLLDLMEERGVLTMKVGDVELTRSPAPNVAPIEEDVPLRPITEADRQKQIRRISLAATSRVVSRAGE